MATSEWTMTREEFMAELRKTEAEWKAKWPTIESMPDWHPSKQIMKRLEEDLVKELSK